jgi:hypothetical protein
MKMEMDMDIDKYIGMDTDTDAVTDIDNRIKKILNLMSDIGEKLLLISHIISDCAVFSWISEVPMSDSGLLSFIMHMQNELGRFDI